MKKSKFTEAKSTSLCGKLRRGLERPSFTGK
jgi:hypothetical protein